MENGVEGVSRDVKGHGVGAGIQGHLTQIMVVVQVGENAPGGGIVLQVIQHPVHLVHLSLRVAVLHPHLIAVGLADGPGFIGPGIPDACGQRPDVVGLLLPDPQQLLHRAFQVHPPDGLDGKFLPQIIAVDQAETFDRMGGGAVLPPGADRQMGVPGAPGQNLLAVSQKDLVCFAHGASSSVTTPKATPSPTAVRVTGQTRLCRFSPFPRTSMYWGV